MAGQLFVNAHMGETRLAQELSRFAEVQTIGLLPGKLWKTRLEPKDDSPGLEHELVLWDRNPALWHCWISWRRLRRHYLEKIRREGMPDILLVRNLQHVFNHFVKWLRKQPMRPTVVLILGDSGSLGENISFSRRFRYWFKPMQMLETKSVLLYDACIISNISAKRYFEPRGIPWTWHPSAFKTDYTPPVPDINLNGPIRFGYFGALSEGYAVTAMVRAFLKANVPGSLHICGFGDMAGELTKLAEEHPNLHFDGFLPKETDCLDWSQKVDVLINTRLPIRGQDNSFPSKVFEYGLAGKAILSTITGGVNQVIEKECIYFDTNNFEESLCERIQEMSNMDRAELQRRATTIRNLVTQNYSYNEQARRMVEFMKGLVNSRNAQNTLH